MSENFWGELIKRLRAEQGVTQRQLASEARVNRATLRGIERGEKPGDMDTMERLLQFLGYEIDAIEVQNPGRHAANSPCNPALQS
jgi:transcriptional regulator with XRE-family HTH domain